MTDYDKEVTRALEHDDNDRFRRNKILKTCINESKLVDVITKHGDDFEGYRILSFDEHMGLVIAEGKEGKGPIKVLRGDTVSHIEVS